MATWRDVLSAIEDKLDGVDGVANTFTYWPDYTTEPEMQEHLMEELDNGKSKINVAFIERRSVGDERGGQASRYPLTEGNREDEFQITYMYGYSDNGLSVYTFNDTVDAVLDAFFKDITIVDSSTVAFGMRAEPLDFVNYGGFMCHRARFSMRIERRKSGPFS